MSVREIESQKLGNVSLVSFDAGVQLAQGYVMLINLPLLQRVDEAARQAFLEAGRTAASAYQRNEKELREKVIGGGFRGISKVSHLPPAEISKPLISALDAQYIKENVSAETMQLLRSFEI